MFQMNLIKKLKRSYRIKISSDNRFLCHNMGSKTVIFDMKTWDKIAELDKPKHPSYMRFSKNNEYLLIKSTTGTICIYNTLDFQVIKTIQSNKGFKIVEGDLNFTQDNLMILDTLATNDGEQIVSININSGEHTILSDFENSITNIKYNHFINKEDSHLFTLSFENNKTGFRDFHLIKVKEPINKYPYERISPPKRLFWDSVIYDVIHDVYILIYRNEIIILDSEFKTVLKKEYVVREKLTGYFQHMNMSNNGKYIVVTYSDNIVILRYDDLKTIFVEMISFPCFAEFSHDDQYLLVGTAENGYILENNLL